MAFYTKYKDKWYEVNLNQSSTLYSPADSNGRNTSTTQAEASNRVATAYSANGSTIYATIASKFTQTISMSSGTYIKSWSVSRGTSPEENASTGVIASGSTSGNTAAVYLNDTLTATATAADTNYSAWSFTGNPQAPTCSTLTDTSFRVSNPNAYSCTVYVGTTNKGSIAANSTLVVSGYTAGTTYSVTLKATPTRKKNTYGTPTLTWSTYTVTSANTLTITGSRTQTTESGTEATSDPCSFTTPYKLTLNGNDKVAKYPSVSYTDNDTGNTTTTTINSNTGIIYVKKGGSWSYTAQPNAYCYFTSAGTGSGSNMSANASFTPTADYGYYYVTVTGVSNGTTRVGTTNAPTATGIAVKYGSTIYCKVKGNSEYYYSSKTAGGYGDAGVLYTTSPFDSTGKITVNDDYFTFSSITPGTSSSITTPTATKTISATCTAYTKYTLSLTKTNATAYVYVKSSHALGQTSFSSKANGATIYDQDVFYTYGYVSYGSRKLTSYSCKVGSTAQSTSSIQYQTVNTSSRTSWTNTTTQASSTGLIYRVNYGTSSSTKTVSNNVIVSYTGTATTYTKHDFNAVTSGWCSASTSTTFSPFGNTGFAKLDYYPTNYIKVDGDVDLSGTSSNFSSQVLSTLNYSASLKHAGLTRRENRVQINSTVATTAPSSINLKVTAGSGGGAYRTTSTVWALYVPE